MGFVLVSVMLTSSGDDDAYFPKHNGNNHDGDTAAIGVVLTSLP